MKKVWIAASLTVLFGASAFISAPLLNAHAQSTHAPIQAGGVMSLDLPDSSAQSVSLDIIKGRFAEYSVGRVTLTGNGVDFRNGSLQGMRADIKDGDFENLLVDNLQISTQAFTFNTMELLNNRTFVLSQPVTATVNLRLSEANINKFIANPKTLSKIEKSIQKQTGGIKLITFSNPSLDLLSGNKVKLMVTGVVAQGLAVPMEMTGKLVLEKGQLKVSNLALMNGGNEVPLPVDVAKAFQERLNEMIDFKRLGKNALVIEADTMKLTGDTLTIDGHATLTRLSFG